MPTIKAQRQILNQQQTELRRLMEDATAHETAVALFMRQHAMLHAEAMTGLGLPSLADAVYGDLAEAQFRAIPPQGEHSIAWLVWHMARIEDVTMNGLVAGSAQLLHDGGWLAQLRLMVEDTGNALDLAAIAALSQAVDVAALRAYRTAVGRRTRQIVAALQPGDLARKVDPARIEQIRASGAVGAGAEGLLDYWSRRTMAGLLLMPPTRHNLVHLNEAWQVRQYWEKHSA